MEKKSTENVSMTNYEFEIFPDNDQRTKLDYWLFLCRHTYNSALVDKSRIYKEKRMNYSRFQMQEQLKADKKKLPFLKDIPSQPLQEVFARLQKAFENFFRGDNRYPKIKKHKDYNSMTFTQFGYNNKGYRMALSFDENGRLFNPKLGSVEIEKHREMEGKIKQVVIKRKGVRWFAIFSVERQVELITPNLSDAVGIDVGINKYAFFSNGESIENPRLLIKSERKLKREQRKLSKMKRGSNNWKKQIVVVQELHLKVANQRKDFLHKASYRISKKYSVVCVEGLNIRNMVKNRKLAKHIYDAGWGMFRNMLDYKCRRNGGLLVRVDPAFTTQDCSTCKNRVKKSLSVRTHICSKCGTILDRDHNASINILDKGLEQIQSL